MDFVIRRATREDVPEMLRLWREMMDFHAQLEPRFRPKPSPDGERAWEAYLQQDIWDSEDWGVFVAAEDGRLVGQIMGNLRSTVPVFEPEDYGYVTDIVVDPQARRRGVGKALFQALKSWFRERGVSHLQLQVAHNNAASRAFWRAVGCSDYMHTLWYDLEAG
ncbi:MAG: GNAT family N-acetyltransferase [Anaerolineae bacterium]|jgi:ribosomal protein S18 acetylase RimI-like enzyme